MFWHDGCCGCVIITLSAAVTGVSNVDVEYSNKANSKELTISSTIALTLACHKEEKCIYFQMG